MSKRKHRLHGWSAFQQEDHGGDRCGHKPGLTITEIAAILPAFCHSATGLRELQQNSSH
ncbi:MAG: hypothetical protein HC895_10380 [Leptolyngbyaceae cyanobacterium SM1_3_5]|nr:hypothetical protein [Leptolyngbyaceae cyanobacterium SM1_3_5]